MLKVGEATLKTDIMPNELVPNCHTLNQAAKARIDSYTKTASMSYKLEYTELALKTEFGYSFTFKDKDVHKVLMNSGVHKVQPNGATGEEWFATDIETVKAAIKSVKNGKSTLSSSDFVRETRQETIDFREEQINAIEKTLKTFKKDDEMLWYAKMRFGKTLSALEVIRRSQYRRVIIATHRPVVDDGWSEDFKKIFFPGNSEHEYHYERKTKDSAYTEHNTQTSNKTCNMYLGAVFRYYQFLALEDVLPVVNDIYRFDLLKEFLNEKCTSCSSITDKKWEELERSYKAFLYKKGLALYVRRNRPDRRNVEQQSSAQVSFLKMYYEYVVKCKTADIPENEKDVWDMRKLDIVPRSNPIRGRYRLDFREIRQKEFKEIIKKILYSHCQTKAMGSIKGELRGFRRFASFMYDRFPEVKHFTEISRDMIEDYLVYIKTDTGLTSVSYTTELSVLDNLLDEIGRELEIGNICNLFLSSDCRAYDNALPEAYSDAEIRRFNCALTKLKPQLGRCLIIHQMLGTRIEDTLTLRRDCLSEKSGHYFITIIQQKTRKYKRPVSDQLAELIRKAIEVSEKEHPDSEYIFLQDNGKLYTDSMLKYHVNIMIYENDIRDDNGNYFEFRTHRFRHTFGVKLTEMKLDDDSIARLLGHKDTRTIPHYRRLRNEALAEDTKAVRDEMNELLAQYRREKENAETR